VSSPYDKMKSTLLESALPPYDSPARVKWLLCKAYNRLGPTVFMEQLLILLNEAEFLGEEGHAS